MRKRVYSANAWGYVHLGEGIGIRDIVGRLACAGYDGFDLLYGVDAYPRIGSEISLKDIVDLKSIAEDNGARISSIVLVSFGLDDEEDCARQLDEGIALAGALDTGRLNLLPRKVGISQEEGFRRLERVWARKGRAVSDAGLVVSAENHIWFDKPDEDIFLLRTADDFIRMGMMLGGQVHVKFDPAWLLKAEDDLLPSFARCLPFVDLLDAKDYAGGKFVTPGTGQVDFKALAAMIAETGRTIDICVEAEEHHFFEPTLLDPDEIDAINRADLQYYKAIFDV